MKFAPNPRLLPKATTPAQRDEALRCLLSAVHGQLNVTATSLGCKTRADFANWAKWSAQRQ